MKRAFRYYFFNILLGIIIVAIVGALGIAIFCTIHKVTVKGNSIYTDEEIQQMVLEEKYANNSVYVTIHNKMKPKRDIPFVERVEVTLTRFDRIKITVKEKQCVGYLAMDGGGYVYFDEDGKVVEISERLVDKCIGVTGVSLQKAELGEKVELKKEQLELMVQLIKSLDKYDLPISVLAFDENGKATVIYENILISVGTSDFLEEKMMRLPHILPQLDGQAGTLHLENWSKDNTDIVFEKPKK